MVLDRLLTPWRNVALAAVGLLVGWFLWSVRGALNPLGVGLLLAYMLHPLVVSLERRGWSRRAAVNVIFGVSGIGGLLLTLALAAQARALWSEVARPNGALSRIDNKLVGGLERVWGQIDRWELFEQGPPPPGPPSGPEASSAADDQDARGDDDTGEAPETEDAADTGDAAETGEAPRAGEARITLQQIFENLQAWLEQEGRLEQAGQAGLRAAGGAWVVLRRVFGSLLTLAGYVLLVPIYTWFLLFELERISAFVRRYIPRGERERFSKMGERIAEMLGNFFRGRMLVCLLKGFILAVALKLAGIPYALLVGILSGFLSLVPIAGPAIGYGLAFLLGLLEFSMVSCLIRMAIVYSIGELLEGYVLLPRVLGDSLGLHPIVVIASLMVFGSALGMFGMLVALPLTSALVIVASELVLPALRKSAEGELGPHAGVP